LKLLLDGDKEKRLKFGEPLCGLFIKKLEIEKDDFPEMAKMPDRKLKSYMNMLKFRMV